MVPAFMLSLLKRQQLMLQDRFGARYPSCWLVWEPGNWTPPRTNEEADGGKTQVPAHAIDLRPRGADALCFQLYLTRGAQEGDLTLGRANESDIVVNDMTVSRSHLKFHFDAKGWTVESVGPPSSVSLGNKSLAPGEQAKLESGVSVMVGGVQLTFYDAAGFLKRITR